MTYRIREVTLRRPRRVEGARLPAGRYLIVEELHKVWAFNLWRRSSQEYHVNRNEAELEIQEIKRREVEEYRALMASWSRSKNPPVNLPKSWDEEKEVREALKQLRNYDGPRQIFYVHKK